MYKNKKKLKIKIKLAVGIIWVLEEIRVYIYACAKCVGIYMVCM